MTTAGQAPIAVAALPDRAGEIIAGRYRLDSLIGRGSMADVYRAVDTKTGNAVAAKIVRATIAKDAEMARRFAREAHVQALVRHPNVAALYESGSTSASEPYLILELLRGKSLRTVLKQQGPMSAARVVSSLWQALQGLSAVHALGVLHRDLKPANLMLEASSGPVERVVLIDFGFANLEGDAKLTQHGHVVGSLTYLAPERLSGDAGDERSDIYAMGIIGYELLTGVPPYTATDDVELASQHFDDPIPSVASVIHDATHVTVLDAILQRALAKSADDRFASAGDMAAALEVAARHIAP